MTDWYEERNKLEIQLAISETRRQKAERQRDALLTVALKLQRLYRGHRDASTYDALLALRDECEAALAKVKGE